MLSALTIPDLLWMRRKRSPDRHAYWRRTDDQGWLCVTWIEVEQRVRSLSEQLRRFGLETGDAVVISLPTSPEWEYCHIAVLAAGGVVVGLDCHDALANIRNVLQTVRPRMMFLETIEQFDEISELLFEAPQLLVVMQRPVDRVATTLEDLLSGGHDQGGAFFPEIDPDQVATIVFTSGSTGSPKGVVYTHRQICLACNAILGRFKDIEEGVRLVCWLPLGNLFQRIINLCAMIRGGETWFVEKPAEIIGCLPQIRPALFIGVPRFYEKLYAGIVADIGRRLRPVRFIINAAWRLGERYAAAERECKAPGFFLRAAALIADSFVLSKVRRIMGPDLRYMVSGSAPLSPWLIERFHGLGWLVLEAYGMTECIVPIALNSPDDYRIGSVGKPLKQQQLSFATDGELLVRGEGVFRGYFGEAAIDASLDSAGYLHTGDYARLDGDGYLWLTGRKSEVFKTTTGRKIAPMSIESRLKKIECIEHVVALGRDRPFVVVVLSVYRTVSETDTVKPLPEGLLQNLASAIESESLALPDYQRPAGAIITRLPFTVDGGELTSNLKLRRRYIEEKYRSEIDALYAAIRSTSRDDKQGCVVMEASCGRSS